MNTESQKRIAVIGAGISGLTCAYELQQAGHEVVVYEKEDTPGGRMRSREKEGLMFDIGATHLIPLYTHMMQYIEEFGIGWEKMDFEQYGMLTTDKRGKREIESIDAGLGVWSSMRLARLFLRIGNDERNTFDFADWTEEDTESAYDFLKRGAGKRVADYIGDAFTAAYQFHRSTEISSGALHAMMQSIKRDRDKWYLHHMTRGMSALPDAFAQRLDVRFGVGVTAVQSSADGYKVTSEAGDTERYDAVVVGTTASVASKMLSGVDSGVTEYLESVKYASTISLAFRIPADSLPQFSITWIPYAEDTHFSGISNEVMKGSDLRDEAGNSLVCTWLHDGYAQEMLSKSDEEVFADARENFVAVCPWFDSVDELEPFDLQRWPEAMPKFEAGLLKRTKKFLEEYQGNNNLYFVGDYLNSPWTEGALECGQRVARQIIADQAQSAAE